jgi:hypothetical protein
MLSKSENGDVAERFKALVLKTSEGLRPPRVRISPSPPTTSKNSNRSPPVLDTCERPLPEVIRWKRQWGSGDIVVWVIVRKLDESWKGDDDRLPLGSCANHSFGRWLRRRHSNREPANMPHVGYCEVDGREFISFTDGRHRFAWCRDNGVRAMPVTVEGRKQAKIVRRLFGSTSRVCRLPRRSRGK